MAITIISNFNLAASKIAFYHSPIGWLKIIGDNDAIFGLSFVDDAPAYANPRSWLLEHCLDQLHAYFRGMRQEFDLPLALRGTAFQRSVWEKLLEIPYGSTASYRDIAQRIGDPKAVRAVGHANGQNPIAIIVPCHRVIGANGKLIGYGGGLWRKQWLLQHEQSMLV